MRLTGFADEIDISFRSQLEAISEFGLSYIDLRAADGVNVADFSQEKLREVKNALNCSNIRVSCIGSPIGKIRIDDDFDAQLNQFKNIIRTAYELETKNIRVFSFYIPQEKNAADYRDRVLQYTEKLIAAAQSENLVLLHENEKGIYGDTAARCEDLMRSLYCDNYKAVFDFANFVECGECPLQAYSKLSKFTHYIHIKDARKSDCAIVPAGYGDGHLKGLLSDFKNSGYDGFLSLEPHLTNFAGLASLQQDVCERDATLDGKSAFKLALDSLLAILDDIKWGVES